MSSDQREIETAELYWGWVEMGNTENDAHDIIFSISHLKCMYE